MFLLIRQGFFLDLYCDIRECGYLGERSVRSVNREKDKDVENEETEEVNLPVSDYGDGEY